ncbi:MAG TPA: DUF5674 family protein [Terriglobales bacterium]|nr:DUF5674 family protein [Terriglobales bacterium]
MIHLIQDKATPQQIKEMLEALETYIKVAVDINRGILAGGGVMHADCEAELLRNGSNQEDIWGADWVPKTQTVDCNALINIRPRQGNLSMKINDQTICSKVELIVKRFLGSQK